MKLTKEHLKTIIQEELQNASLDEGMADIFRKNPLKLDRKEFERRVDEWIAQGNKNAFDHAQRAIQKKADRYTQWAAGTEGEGRLNIHRTPEHRDDQDTLARLDYMLKNKPEAWQTPEDKTKLSDAAKRKAKRQAKRAAQEKYGDAAEYDWTDEEKAAHQARFGGVVDESTSKLTKLQLKQIIKEELNKVIAEDDEKVYANERAWIASYIDAWFNSRAASHRGPAEDPRALNALAGALRRGAGGIAGDRYRAGVDFNKALRLDGQIQPENVDHFADALGNLADAIEADPTLFDKKKIGSKHGDWYAYAQRT
jgi:hypothetical protein